MTEYVTARNGKVLQSPSVRTWELSWPLLTVAGAWLVQWLALPAFGLIVFAGHGVHGCWGQVVAEGPDRGFCHPALGWLSLLLYLPQLLALFALIVGAVLRRVGIFQTVMLVSAASIMVPIATVIVTHGQAFQQMPVFHGW
jgi:hypothetical protein